MRKKILLIICIISIFTCATACSKGQVRSENSGEPVSSGKEMELDYASQFSVTKYDKGYSYIKIEDGNEYVLIPEGEKDTNLGYENATLIHVPCKSVYVAASSTMDQFRALDALGQVTSCSTSADDYSISEVSDKINKGEIVYVGKYKAPDYEKLLSLNTDLAIESTMIYHVPKTKEELESFKIPVLVDRSSYEEDPLGRIEWIKLYGMLVGREEEASEKYNEQIEQVKKVIKETGGKEEDKPTVVFFYLSANGYVNVRKPGDYVTKMIEMAGGSYALKSIEVEEENALSTMNISWEDFYTYAKNADILIYNGTIDGGINSLSGLTDKNSLFEDFKAVRDKRVYCSSNNMYQESSRLGEVIVDLNTIIDNSNQPLTFFLKLE